MFKTCLSILLAAVLTESLSQEIPSDMTAPLPYGMQDTTLISDTAMVDSVSVVTPGGEVRKKIVKRDFSPKEQIVIGATIMTFVVIILTTTANWNP